MVTKKATGENTVIIPLVASYIVTKISNLGVAMKDYIEDRVIEISQYIIDNNSTVRAAAKVFNVSKSTVHTEVVVGVGFL